MGGNGGRRMEGRGDGGRGRCAMGFWMGRQTRKKDEGGKDVKNKIKKLFLFSKSDFEV